MYESTACSRNTTPVVFSIYSEMCVMGGCGKYGRCYQFFSGGNMFSTCQCFAGYRGWGCTDASQVQGRPISQYRARKNDLHNVISTTQAGLGRLV